MDLAGVMALIRDVNPYYVDMLVWDQQHGIITATPKKPLSDLAHRLILKVFQQLDGNYVSHAGQAWFELVVLEESKPRPSASDDSPQEQEPKVSPLSMTSPLASGILRQTEAQLTSLIRAAQQLLEEA